MNAGINEFSVTMAQNKNLEQKAISDLKHTKNEKDLKKVCNDFESFFTQQILDISLKSSKVAGEGTGSEIIKGMYTESLAKQSAGTLGISDMLFKFL
ncbi:MAG: rod-binding protein, partial [Arcobacter sp.]|nr:rod-binding protein [Arcobacter sp.]